MKEDVEETAIKSHAETKDDENPPALISLTNIETNEPDPRPQRGAARKNEQASIDRRRTRLHDISRLQKIKE